jgi:hypothetical protein
MWDNTAPGAKTNPKSPDYKCKSRECGHAIWLNKRPPKPDTGPAKWQGSGTVKGPKWTWAELQQAYGRCLKIAAQQIGRVVPKAGPADIIAGAATLFIAATRDGVRDAPPDPLKAAPPGEHATAGALSERPEQLQGEVDDSLPF